MKSDKMNIIEKRESNVRSYVRSFPTVFSSAKDSWISASNGDNYLDFFCSAGSLNYGHNNNIAIESILAYLEKNGILNSLDFATTAKINFIETFDNLILNPRKFKYKYQFTGPTGTDAVEAAIKLARLATARSTIMACNGSFHGVTLGSLSATASKYFRDASGVELKDVKFLPFNKVESLELIRETKPAAVILETIQCEGGINIATEEWIHGVADFCKNTGSLLIVDDIQAGCGRSGNFFSFEKYGITPDIVVLSKSLSGSGLPFSLLLINPDTDIWQPGQHNGTFRGNNLAFVSATAIIKEYWAKYGKLEAVIQRKAELINHFLNELVLTSSHLVELRGRGMIYGIECINTETAALIQKEAFNQKLIIERCGKDDEVIKIMPSILINEEDLLRGLSILANIIGGIEQI